MTPDEVIEPSYSLSLTPYSGTWTKDQAAHLLRRTMFGPTFAQIQQAVADGMDVTVAQLLTLPVTDLPLTYLPNELIVPFGETWVDAVYPTIGPSQVDDARRGSLTAWMIKRINQPTVSIQEKMCLFWNNHFGVEESFDARAIFNLMDLYRSSCLGDFKQLVKDVTLDPSMLAFLNGHTNFQSSPNENYSRELLELFTVGKGPQIGPGDYTNYTEADVAAGAKILTGWSVQGWWSDTMTSPQPVFVPSEHDTSDKTLSSHFGGVVITSAGDQEYANYIDAIFAQPNMGKFICRKLYRWFVNYDLTPEVESTIIAELNAILEANNFVIFPVIEALLKSEHFYDSSLRGTIIKNPLEFVFSMFNATSTSPNFGLVANSELYVRIYYFSRMLGMTYFTPPNVGGWSAYYQAPSFSRLWVSSGYLNLRSSFAKYLTIYDGIPYDGIYFKVNALGFLNGLSNPSDAQQTIDDTVDVFCPNGLSLNDKLLLKSILTNSLPDFEWTVEYNNYAADPSNNLVSDPIRQRVEQVLNRLFQMPEFQTI